MGKSGGCVKCLNGLQEGPANRLYFAHKIFGRPHHGGGGCCYFPLIKVRKIYFGKNLES
jgi:hypothetical protein